MKRSTPQSSYQRQMGNSNSNSSSSTADRDEWAKKIRDSKQKAGLEIDKKFGYEEFGGRSDDDSKQGGEEKEGWLFNMVPTVSISSDSNCPRKPQSQSHIHNPSDPPSPSPSPSPSTSSHSLPSPLAKVTTSSTGQSRSGLTLFFLTLSRSTFKSTIYYRPYFFVTLSSPSYTPDCIAHLTRKYESHGLTATEVKKEDLEMGNHLSGKVKYYI